MINLWECLVDLDVNTCIIFLYIWAFVLQFMLGIFVYSIIWNGIMISIELRIAGLILGFEEIKT